MSNENSALYDFLIKSVKRNSYKIEVQHGGDGSLRRSRDLWQNQTRKVLEPKSKLES